MPRRRGCSPLHRRQAQKDTQNAGERAIALKQQRKTDLQAQIQRLRRCLSAACACCSVCPAAIRSAFASSRFSAVHIFLRSEQSSSAFPACAPNAAYREGHGLRAIGRCGCRLCEGVGPTESGDQHCGDADDLTRAEVGVDAVSRCAASPQGADSSL
jgi:hypothetical protein